MATPPFDPAYPCALGSMWMPWQDDPVTLDTPGKLAAPALHAGYEEDIRAIWLPVCARFSNDGAFAFELFDISGDELPAFGDLVTISLLPDADVYHADGTTAFSPLFPPPTGSSGTHLAGAVNDITPTPGLDEFGRPFYDNSYVRGAPGQQLDVVFSLADAISAIDVPGRWINNVAIRINSAEMVLNGKQPGYTARAYLFMGGKRYYNTKTISLGSGGLTGDESSWSWFANPATGLPWTVTDVGLFDESHGAAADGIGIELSATNDVDLLPTLSQAAMDVVLALSDQRIAMGGGQPDFQQGWTRFPIVRTTNGVATNWHKHAGHKYLFTFRKSRGDFPVALCATDEPGVFMPGPPSWSSFDPETTAASDHNPSLRPRRLGPELSRVYGAVLERSDGEMSLDSNPYATTSPTSGPDAWPLIGAFFDLAPVNSVRIIEQEFTPTSTQQYGWLQLRLAQVSNVLPAPLIVELRDRATSTLHGTWTFTTDDLAGDDLPKRLWQRVGKRCDDVTAPTVNSGTQYFLRLRSSSPEDSGWLVQCLNGGTNGGPPVGPPFGSERATIGGIANALTDGGVDQRFADLEFLLSTIPPKPTGLTATPVAPVCGISRIVVSWVDPGVTSACGLDFTAWEVQRSADGGATWERIAMEAQQAVVSIDDREVHSNHPEQYRVRTVREDGARSDWSNVATATAVQTFVGLVLTSNILPERSVACEDLGGQRDATHIENVVFQQTQGRNFQIGFSELEDRGLSISATLLVRAGTQMCMETPCYDYTKAGWDVFQPLLDLLRAGLPYVCVRNEAGQRWYAKIESPTLHWRRSLHTRSVGDVDRRGNYTLDVKITQVTDQAFAPNLGPGSGFGVGSGSGSGSGSGVG